MVHSILSSIKQVVGIEADDTAFDTDILMHTNTAFFTLNQLGIGPESGFMIYDSSTVWADYLGADLNLNAVKTYIFLRVRTLFDPPSTSFHQESINKQITELEWRLNTEREYRAHPIVVEVVSPE